jgi:hypothetical protein
VKETPTMQMVWSYATTSLGVIFFFFFEGVFIPHTLLNICGG